MDRTIHMRNLSPTFEPHGRHCVVNALSGMATRDIVPRVTNVEVVKYSEVVWMMATRDVVQRITGLEVIGYSEVVWTARFTCAHEGNNISTDPGPPPFNVVFFCVPDFFREGMD